jgi:hypothetical protein
MELEELKTWWCEFDSSGSCQRRVAGSCEHGNKHLVSKVSKDIPITGHGGP